MPKASKQLKKDLLMAVRSLEALTYNDLASLEGYSASDRDRLMPGIKDDWAVAARIRAEFSLGDRALQTEDE